MMNTDATTTMYQACLWHSRADRHLRLLVAQKLSEHKITMMQWLLLDTVCQQGKAITMSQVADVLEVTLPQVTALTSQLIETNLLTQAISTKDRRSRRLACTPAGKRLARQLQAAIEPAMEQWLGPVDAAEAKAYLAAIKQLAERR